MAGITVDQLQVLVTANTAQLKSGLSSAKSDIAGLGTSASKSGSMMSSAFTKVGKASTLALKGGVVGAIAAVTASIPGAVKRIDTLVAFPRVLEAMGISSEKAAKATEKLSTKLTGLPTPLQDGAAGVQKLVAAGLSIEDATDTFLAFNNATLASSASTAAAEGAFSLLTKSISKGKIEGQEWNSLIETMPTAFKALSNETNKTTGELQELYKTDPKGLIKDLQRLDKEGGGGLASLEKQARAATGGIGTSFANMKNSIVKGLQAIVTEMGNGKLEAGQKKISYAITALGKGFASALEIIAELGSKIMSTLMPSFQRLGQVITNDVIPAITAIVTSPFAQFIGTVLVGAVMLAINAVTLFLAPASKLAEWLVTTTPLIMGIVGAIAGYKAGVILATAATAAHTAIVTALAPSYIILNGSIMVVKNGLTLATIAQTALNTAMAANPIGLLVAALGLMTGALLAQSAAGRGGKTAQDALNQARVDGKRIANELKESEDILAGAKLSEESASLAVERAQLNVNAAIATYGEGSLEHREAVNQKSQAELRQKDAIDAAKDAQKEKTKKEKENNDNAAETKRAEAVKQLAFEQTTGKLEIQDGKVTGLT